MTFENHPKGVDFAYRGTTLKEIMSSYTIVTDDDTGYFRFRQKEPPHKCYSPPIWVFVMVEEARDDERRKWDRERRKWEPSANCSSQKVGAPNDNP